jgi:hypothetical protein
MVKVLCLHTLLEVLILKELVAGKSEDFNTEGTEETEGTENTERRRGAHPRGICNLLILKELVKWAFVFS